MLIKPSLGPNPLRGWQVERGQIRHIGVGLERPECILAEADGTLWSADARGGVMKISQDGRQELIVPGKKSETSDNAIDLFRGTLPNGLAFAANGDILIANFGTDRLEVMTRTGQVKVLCETIDGMALGKVNFVLRDRQNRIWVTVSTKVNPWNDALRPDLADGYIAVLDERGLRVVADGLHFTNEIRMDAQEEWLYVAETTAKRVSRFRVGAQGALTHREVYGPSQLGDGLIDGICFDAYGNLWATMILADRLVAITPEGEALELLNDGDPAATAKFEAEFGPGRLPSKETLMATGGPICNWLASVTFGGTDLKTVYLGGLRATNLPYFQSPVAGLPMSHWTHRSYS